MSIYWTLGTYLLAAIVGAGVCYKFEQGSIEKLQSVIDAGVQQHKVEVAAAVTSETQHETDIKAVADTYTNYLNGVRGSGITCTVHSAKIPDRPAVSGAEPPATVEQSQAAASFDESAVVAILKQGDECITTLNDAKIWAQGMVKATAK